jgi:hypothetical protein
MASYWKCATSNYEEFSLMDSSFQCYNENEDCEEANCGETSEDIRKAMRMTQLSLNE